MVQKIEIKVVAVVFIENKHILPKHMTNTIDKYFFTYLPMRKGKKNAMKKVILLMYKDSIQIRKKEIFPLFRKSICYYYGFSIWLATVKV